MSIPYLPDKIKGSNGVDKTLIFHIILIVLVSIGSFFLGRISTSTQDHEKVDIVNTTNQIGDLASYNLSSVPKNNQLASNTSSEVSSRVYVASKNGKLYYRVGCGASSRILDRNQVFFQTETEAQNAGFSPSSSCTP